MPKHSVRTVLSITTVALLVSLTIFVTHKAVLNYIQPILNMQAKPSPQADPNAFNKLVNKDAQNNVNTVTPQETELMKDFPDDPEALDIARLILGSGVVAHDPDAKWGYKDTSFTAKVETVSASTNYLEITIDSPPRMPLLNTKSKVDISGCTVNNSYEKFAGEMVARKVSDSFVSVVAPGDTLISFCADDTCSKLARLCLVVKDLPKEE